MTLKDILVVSGHGGLFKYISQGRNSIVVENLSDNKRTTLPASAKFNMLEEIVVYTEEKEIPLREVLAKIQAKESGGAAIQYKAPDADLKKYFAEAVPEYDRNRVYVSDIRKIVKWYNLLLELGITDFEAPKEANESEEDCGSEPAMTAQAEGDCGSEPAMTAQEEVDSGSEPAMTAQE